MDKKPRMGEDPLSRLKDITTPADQLEAPETLPATQKVRKPSSESPQKLKEPLAREGNKRRIPLSLKKLESMQAELDDLKKQNLALMETVARMQIVETQLREKEIEILNLKQEVACFEEKIQFMEPRLVGRVYRPGKPWQRSRELEKTLLVDLSLDYAAKFDRFVANYLIRGGKFGRSRV